MAIEFSCPHCHELVRTADAAAGKKGRCPHCQAVVQIPAVTQPVHTAQPAAQHAPLAPRGRGAEGERGSAWKGQPAGKSAQPAPRPKAPPADNVEELPTLAPLDSVPGLAPLGAVPGLTPLGGAPSYSPLGPPPDPLAGDVLAGLPAAQVSGRTLAPTHIIPAPSYGAAAPNPLGTPVGYAGGYGDYHDISDAGRKGLPWQREATFDNFQDTVAMVLGEPQVAFPQMRRRGGLMNSLAYAIIGLLIGQLATTVYVLVLNLIVLMSAGAPAEGFAALGIAAAFMLLGNLIGALIGAIIGSFLAAGVWHVILMMFGCTRGGFEGTYRAVCFTAGSIALLNVVPIVGPLIGLIMGIVVLIHAFIHTHEAPSGRVVTAVLIPYALLCCCMVPGLFMALGGLMQGMQRGF